MPGYGSCNDLCLNVKLHAQSIGDECYGGEETIFQHDEYRRTQSYRKVEKTRSAYMLIYERIVPQTPISTIIASPTSSRPVQEEEEEDVEGEPVEKGQEGEIISPAGKP